MLRLLVIAGAVLFCVLNAPAPDPRVVAAINAAFDNSPQLDVDGGEFYCPMDADIRSQQPGVCPRCGMTLVADVRDGVEFPVDLTSEPAAIQPGEPVRLRFGVVDPKTEQAVREYRIVHEMPYHVFVVSQDLRFFLHTHPERKADEAFHLDMRFPRAGLYRVLSDFYPAGGFPQLTARSVLVGGAGFRMEPAHLRADIAPRQTENARVEMLPTPMVAGQKSSLKVRVSPAEGLEPYLGAAAHMLAVSSDVIDMMHTHPVQSIAGQSNAYRDMEFSMLFPRSGVYRMWIQFQRRGVVNTAAFDVPVE